MGKMELIITLPSNVIAIAEKKWNLGEKVEANSQVFQGRLSNQITEYRQKIIKEDLIKFMNFELERNYPDSNFDIYK